MASISELADFAKDNPRSPGAWLYTFSSLSKRLENVWTQIEPFDREVEMVEGPAGEFTASDFREGFARLRGKVQDLVASTFDFLKDPTKPAREKVIGRARDWFEAYDSAASAMVDKVERLSSIPVNEAERFSRAVGELAKESSNAFRNFSNSVIRTGAFGLVQGLVVFGIYWFLIRPAISD